jgi:hypothetical protein
MRLQDAINFASDPANGQQFGLSGCSPCDSDSHRRVRETGSGLPTSEISWVTIEPGQHVPLFQTALNTPQNPGLKRFDVTADGQRFLILSPVASTPAQANPDPITAVINWTAALKK